MRFCSWFTLRQFIHDFSHLKLTIVYLSTENPKSLGAKSRLIRSRLITAPTWHRLGASLTKATFGNSSS